MVSQYVIEDPVISNKHLRIYTIIFDHENPEEIAPLVYAQDISSNGTLWNNNWIEKSNSSVLLSDGDILTLSGRFHILFQCATTTAEPFDRMQYMEMKVCLSYCWNMLKFLLISSPTDFSKPICYYEAQIRIGSIWASSHGHQQGNRTTGRL